MSNKQSKVLWLEGMTLDPHHFQQAERHGMQQIHARIRSLTPHYWGITSLEIDSGRLTNGEVSISQCSGVLSDGYVFSLPADGLLPPSRSVADAFDPSAARLNVFLCLPMMQVGANLQDPDSQQSQLSRYKRESLSVMDENTGFEERDIEVAKPDFQIRFENEQLDGFVTIQITSVVRSSGGYYEQDAQFIAPSLSLGASAPLTKAASDVLELCLSKSSELDARRGATASQRQLTPADVTAIGLLSAVNSCIPVLKNHLAGSGSHPAAVFDTFLLLAGHLSAYSSDTSINPREFPVYDHSNLTDCINRMSGTISAILGGAKPSRHYRQLVLSPVRENLFQTEITADELAKADIILSVKSGDMPEAKLIAELPGMIRIAAPDMIEKVLQSYTRAIQISHTSRLPVGMPEDPLCSYFKMERAGPFWDGIVESGQLAVFVPAEYSGMELKLVAIMRGA